MLTQSGKRALEEDEEERDVKKENSDGSVVEGDVLSVRRGGEHAYGDCGRCEIL